MNASSVLCGFTEKRKKPLSSFAFTAKKTTESFFLSVEKEKLTGEFCAIEIEHAATEKIKNKNFFMQQAYITEFEY